jgi:hypothetical protein
MQTLKRYGWILLLLHGCVDPFPVPQREFTSRLVIDALITDQPGPHTVMLSLSSNLRNDYTSTIFVSGADIRITDDLNNSITLREVNSGNYQTQPESWQPVFGRSYVLSVRLPDGREFTSDPQQLSPAGEIEDVWAEFIPNSINSGDASQPQHAFWVYSNTRGQAGAPNLFRWRTKGVYEVLTYPELRTTFDGQAIVPNPPPCSIGVCTCCNCWITEYDRQAKVSANENAVSATFSNIFMTMIPVDPFRFYTKYYLEVEQLSLPESAYDFWRKVQAQQAGATDIFQPNAIRIEGNVRSSTNPEDKAYGLVSFSAVTRKSIFIYHSDIPVGIPPIPVVTDDCRLLDRNASNVRPSFW